MEVSTKLLIQFLVEKGFIRSAGDPFSCTYVRAKMAISLDHENPVTETAFLREDLERQRHLERATIDKFFDELFDHIRQLEKRGNS
ncbi:MAG: hypothetical protein Q8R28_14585 [Dehalococcoidia bacterium]|nr:hypothetical protein [Dehalococcoidia bacterium]